MQAKITYYNPFSTDLSALPSVVISFSKSGGASSGDVARLDGEIKQIIGATGAGTDIFSGASVSVGYIDGSGNIKNQ